MILSTPRAPSSRHSKKKYRCGKSPAPPRSRTIGSWSSWRPSGPTARLKLRLVERRLPSARIRMATESSFTSKESGAQEKILALFAHKPRERLTPAEILRRAGFDRNELQPVVDA